MRLIPVCSGKGGTGVSCVAAYAASAMAAMKKKTLLIDAGRPPGSLDIILGLENSAVFNLWDVLSGECEPQKAILHVPKKPGLFLIPSGISPGNAPEKTGLSELIRSLKNDYDFIFVDAVDLTALNPKAASAVLIVTTPDTLAVRATAQESRDLYNAGWNNLRLVINNVPARVPPMRSFNDFDDIIDQIGAQLIAVIPSSQRLSYSAGNGLPLGEESITVQVFSRLAGRLRGRPDSLLIR